MHGPPPCVCQRTEPWAAAEHSRCEANQLARTMNASDRHSRYKGLNVTVRWQMVYGKSSLAPLFNTSYSIAEMDDEPPHWHYFPDRLFHSKEYAAAFALREARWLIDRRA